MPLFKLRSASERDLLPWWHPWALMRSAWNLAFSAALGAAIGFLCVEFLAQILARFSDDDWRQWSERLHWLGWVLGCFVAFVSYMAYRMEDAQE
ncbi:hypothetical protein [Ferrovibrio sp.]|uniref:hypothetical protein n=1 Tax=Ferrovibrio sp. TaxID=1917215 RepID=UPI003D0BC258